jgi:hypothetical protein
MAILVYPEKTNYAVPPFSMRDYARVHPGDNYEEIGIKDGVIRVFIKSPSETGSVVSVTKRHIASVNMLEKVSVVTNYLEIIQWFHTVANPVQTVNKG